MFGSKGGCSWFLPQNWKGAMSETCYPESQCTLLIASLSILWGGWDLGREPPTFLSTILFSSVHPILQLWGYLLESLLWWYTKYVKRLFLKGWTIFSYHTLILVQCWLSYYTGLIREWFFYMYLLRWREEERGGGGRYRLKGLVVGYFSRRSFLFILSY